MASPGNLLLRKPVDISFGTMRGSIIRALGAGSGPWAPPPTFPRLPRSQTHPGPGPTQAGPGGGWEPVLPLCVCCVSLMLFRDMYLSVYVLDLYLLFVFHFSGVDAGSACFVLLPVITIIPLSFSVC